MGFFCSFRVSLMWTQSKKSFFSSVGGQLLSRHERTLFSQTTSHAGMEKYSWYTNRWFSLGTWWTYIPIIFICTVAVLRQLRLSCATVHRRSCKQNNWHFLVQFCVHFCCFFSIRLPSFSLCKHFSLDSSGLSLCPNWSLFKISVWKAVLA